MTLIGNNHPRGSFAWIVLFGLLFLPGLADSSDSKRDEWPQWRGPRRDGKVSSFAAAWPDSLDESRLTPLWRVSLGPSYSGPIVVGDRVFVTETVDEKTEVVRALDKQTGKELWKAEWPGAMKMPFYAARNGDWIRSTPACDGERLYVGGIRDILVCLRCEDGKELWRFDFVKECKAPLPKFGLVCSPLIDGDDLYIQAGASFCKLDKTTGKLLWRTLVISDGKFDSAYSSPVIATIQGKRQLVVQTRTKLAGVDPENGTVLWSQEVPAFRGMNIYTPIVLGDRIFASTFQRGSFLYEIRKDDDGFSSELVWKTTMTGYMSTPVVVDSHAYVFLANRRATCVNLKDGQKTWTSKPFGDYWSLVTNGKNILALDSKGELVLLAANPKELQILDRRKISDDETWGHLAVCGGKLFVRELGAVSAYRWEKPKAK